MDKKKHIIDTLTFEEKLEIMELFLNDDLNIELCDHCNNEIAYCIKEEAAKDQNKLKG